MQLSIITLNWNTKEMTKRCIESWMAQVQECIESGVLKDAEMIVVENGSTDGSVALLREIKNPSFAKASTFTRVSADKPAGKQKSKVKSADDTDFVLLENKENVGYARGNNQGIRAARGEYLLLVNSDAFPEPGAVKTLVSFMNSHPEADILSPRLIFPDDRGVQRNIGRFPTLPVVFVMLFVEHLGGSDYVRWAPKFEQQIDWAVGATFLVRKKVFTKIGGLDEQIFMYFEEVEWFYRAYLAGFKAFFTPKAEVIHFERASSNTGKKRPIIQICSGLLYFYQKHKPRWQCGLVWLMIIIKALMAYGVGVAKNDQYLKETYWEVLRG